MLALRTLAILLLVVLSTTGCFALRPRLELPPSASPEDDFDALLETSKESSQEPSEAETPPRTEISRKLEIANAERRLTSTIQLPSKSGLRGKEVETDGWRITAADRRFLTSYFRQPHWRHRELDSVLQDKQRDEILSAAAEAENPQVLATAAIGQTRRGQVNATALIDAIENRDLPTSTRCAALEALALAGEQVAIDQLYESRDEWMAPRETKAAEVLSAEKLEAELMYALAIREHVRSDERVLEALASNYDDVRAAALDAMYLDWNGQTPKEAQLLLEDRAEMVSAAARRTAAPLGDLQRAIGSPSMSIRRDAVCGMARCKDQAAADVLAAIDENSAIVCVLAAIDVWVIRGEFDRIADFASSTEHRIRCAVAEQLAIDRELRMQAVAPKLLGDSSTLVRDLTLDSLEHWPKRSATETMLTALRTIESPYSGKVIAQRLAMRLGEPKPAADETVEQSLQRLENAWRSEFGSLGGEGESPVKKGISREAALQTMQLVQQYEQATSDAEANEIRRQLMTRRELILDTLDQLAPELREVPLPRLQANVLPEIDADFAHWKQTLEKDEALRLSALRALEEASRKHQLNQYLLEQISLSCRLDAPEEEMHAILEIVKLDRRPAAARIVGLALHHRAATVRRLSIAWCERFTNQDYGGILSTMVTDKDRGVRLAAAVTLRHYPGSTTETVLLQTLADDDAELAVAAAGSLAYLHVQEGVDALNRFSRDRVERTRRLAVEAMGTSGEQLLIPTLIRTLGDSKSVQHAALIALPKVVGEDVAAREKGFRDANSQVAAWQTWYAGQVGTPE
ncbi:HEAT repeat domain-containing protein [Blastopirellula sp. JC732]|uniref:HEAT repeat domain-containing protein n=1 Tax=Blastopirellula sediminis TaxID=2894196 RepID=A0A9X1MJ58_9BACT|nr:HEAT repeat domain-containing protein [Blastopirellula sediminis]MCC9609698.1 HEAT repeat domain-containing protein [Blastopirellula sediminis]MCC9627526.1 HEAT repeat domain-containing protein [Blastopirellula sediminis]